jgi:hypothetical protein
MSRYSIAVRRRYVRLPRTAYDELAEPIFKRCMRAFHICCSSVALLASSFFFFVLTSGNSFKLGLEALLIGIFVNMLLLGVFLLMGAGRCVARYVEHLTLTSFAKSSLS